VPEAQNTQPVEYLIAHIGHTQKGDEHILWWKPDSRGYTACVDKAGRYSEEKALSICGGGECIAVPVVTPESMARSTPYFRLSTGRLARLYDGGPHRPVENCASSWRTLLSARRICSKNVSRPTPMAASKRRAIYLTPGDVAEIGRDWKPGAKAAATVPGQADAPLNKDTG